MHERLRRFGYRLAVAGLVLSGAYYGLYGGVYSVADIRSMQSDRTDLMDAVDSLVSVTDSLVQRGDSLQANPEAIERVAREEYGFVRDGELLVRFVPGPADGQIGD
ncbi:MAG: septum formation initiator family protein [Gemmatimonadota bacterium]|nr:septum formation initiator family protein [Gemmatimonadota bacterium]